MNVTEDHLRIVQLLRKDPRMPFLEISRRTGIALEKVFDIYHHLKQERILKTVTILDINDCSVINVFIIFQPLAGQMEALRYLRKSVNVNSVSVTERDFIVHASFLDLDEYDRFIDGLENIGIEGIDDYFISEVII